MGCSQQPMPLGPVSVLDPILHAFLLSRCDDNVRNVDDGTHAYVAPVHDPSRVIFVFDCGHSYVRRSGFLIASLLQVVFCSVTWTSVSHILSLTFCWFLHTFRLSMSSFDFWACLFWGACFFSASGVHFFAYHHEAALWSSSVVF